MGKIIDAFNNKVEQMLQVWDKYKETVKANDYVPIIDSQFLKYCEYKYLGFNFFVTPFDNYISALIDDKVRKGICLESFEELRKCKNVSKPVPVYIKSVRELKDKNGNTMCFMTLEDRTGDECMVPVFASCYEYVESKVEAGVVAFMLLYNTDDTYRGGQQIMLGTKKWQEPSKYASFVIPLRKEV